MERVNNDNANMILDEFIDTFKGKFRIIGDDNSGYTTLVTPYYDVNGDNIAFALYENDDKYIVSDTGSTMVDFIPDLDDMFYQNIVQEIVDNHKNVYLESNEIYTEFKKEHLSSCYDDITELVKTVQEVTKTTEELFNA